MFWLFRASSFNQPVGNWNTSKVTNMAGTFMTNNFNQSLAFNDNGTPGDTTDDKWNTANVTDMNYMFYGARFFNQDISGWNTGKVTNMNYMFQGAYVFNQNIGGWDVSKVTNMAQMFQSAYAFNQNL